MSRVSGSVAWSVLALFAVTAVALDIGRWGATRWSAGEIVLALVPAILLVVAVSIARWVATHRGPTRNAGQIVALGSSVVLVGYALTITLGQE